ncbi:MAG: hypothetical protein IPP97_25995 [Candidatus Obscuribacter sp.]|nr:hypothetical protein [Candidatus Obscuribacter sp.]MBP6348356.1 hypothetical protein [Candidatus Obscuribacter sp.]
MQIVIFGGGLQGLVIAKNLQDRPEKPQVTIADIVEPQNLPAGIKGLKVDVLDLAQVKTATKGADALVLAVPSSIAHKALTNLLTLGIPVCDVSFTPDPPLSLDSEAKKSGACCVVDCGVAPGLSHILVGAAYRELGGLDEVEILVGGMPQAPPEVFRHAIYFNPSDLIAEYVRPARARSKGQNIAPSPLEAKIEPYHDKDLGHIESFLSDGLRSLLDSFPDVAEMNERTLRWSGHLPAMKFMHKLGLFEDAVIAQTAKSLNSHYPASAFEDYLLMVVTARKGNKTLSWRMLDKHTQGTSAMSRTTGYTTAAVTMLLAKKMFTAPGVHAPEVLGNEPELVKALLADLSERGVECKSLEMSQAKA